MTISTTVSRNRSVAVLILVLIVAFFFLLSPSALLAHGGGDDAVSEEELSAETDKDLLSYESLREINFWGTGIAAGVLLLLVLLSVVHRNPSPGRKKRLFLLIVFVAVVATVLQVGTTLYINLRSETGGPVHWHADFMIVACGSELAPEEQKGLSNKLGTDVLHEHEDRRIHVEGVVENLEDVSLESFFAAQGGNLTDGHIILSTSAGIQEFRNGDLCPNGTRGTLQAFVYSVEGDTVTQHKIDDYAHYVPAPFATVPPGECLILEFGPEKAKTEYLCDFYSVAIEKGELQLIDHVDDHDLHDD